VGGRVRLRTLQCVLSRPVLRSWPRHDAYAARRLSPRPRRGGTRRPRSPGSRASFRLASIRFRRCVGPLERDAEMPKKHTTRARSARVAARGGEQFTTALRRQSSGPEVHAGEGHDRLELEFTGEIFQWRGPAPYYFVRVPEEESLELKAVSSGRYYRGMIRVRAWIGDTEWSTSLWPKDGCYVLPIRDSVRKPRGLVDGDTVTIRLIAAAAAPEARQAPAQARSAEADRAAPRVAGRRQPRNGADQRARRSRAGLVEGRAATQVSDEQLGIVPANEASWEDLQAIFGVRGAPSRCLCQMHRLRRGEDFCGSAAVRPDEDELASRLREQTACGQPNSTTTTGLVAYLDGEPVGWCAVDSRPGTPRMLSHGRVPWMGRTEDKSDASVWAVTCFVTRAGYRRRGISRALARTAVDFARQRGARALEGYPYTSEYSHLGTPSVFAAAGLVEVHRPTTKRLVMRIDF
jgi:GNAT superfamily N-acetyltransferase